MRQIAEVSFDPTTYGLWAHRANHCATLLLTSMLVILVLGIMSQKKTPLVFKNNNWVTGTDSFLFDSRSAVSSATGPGKKAKIPQKCRGAKHIKFSNDAGGV